jgi:hypothetical protein
MEIFGGKLVVSRDDAGALSSEWTSPGAPAVVRTNLAHIGRFTIDPDVVRALTPDLGQTILLAKWEGGHRPWLDTPETHAFEKRLHGWVEEKDGVATGVSIPGSACWIAPHAVRVHLANVFRPYFRAFASDPPPGLFVAAADPF